MYALGHVGAALLVYAPVAALLTSIGRPDLATVGTATAVALATSPDVDQRFPVDHRGPTHTVWFGAGCGIGTGILTAMVSPLAGVVGATAAFLAVCSHLGADVVTPMGIMPLAPLSDWEHSFDIVPSRNSRANIAVLVAGVTATAGSQVIVLM